MPNVYIVSNYGKLSKKGDTLIYECENYTSTIFPFRTDELIFIGRVDITGAALSLLMKHQIDTVFLSSNGKFNGKLTFSEKKNVFLRLKQYKLLENYDSRLLISKKIADSKLKNQITFLYRMNRKNKFASDLISNSIDKIKTLLPYIEQATDVQQIRGYEGIGAKNYFAAFGKDIIQDWAIFNGRSRNPPKDNVNAVLSFLYTLLYQRVDAAIESEDLDPYIGMYHEIDYGKRTLSFDLMEEFRVPIVDTLTISLFNLGILSKEDFREVEFSTESDEYPIDGEEKDQSDKEDESREGKEILKRKLRKIQINEDGIEVFGSENIIDEKISKSTKGVLLNESGLKKCIEGFEKKMATTLISPFSGKTISYLGLIREQVKGYKRFVNGEESSYKPYQYK
ncbi:MAG TPA: CRISPR-associated endonuclease Cas1 [Exilispira sp.]|nr:CRISPR-associated endonuclease Cas1 [Exilispira sp.]